MSRFSPLRISSDIVRDINKVTSCDITADIIRASVLCVVFSLALLGCESDYNYRDLLADRVDIHDVADCVFEDTEDGWEQYSCVPIFSNVDPDAAAWERESIGDFDIVQREIFGAPFYQMWYSGNSGTGPNDGHQIGYALSMDGVDWRRHPYNPVLQRGTGAGSFDRDDASVGCVAFDGDSGVFHLWYTGTNGSGIGTTFGHGTSPDGVHWTKNLLNPIDVFRDTSSPLSRVWGCDALYEGGQFHFWVGAIVWDGSVANIPDLLTTSKYNIGYLSTIDGATFIGEGDIVLEHGGFGSDLFDAEGVHKPSVFTFREEGQDESDPAYWMLYAGYEDVIAQENLQSGLINVRAEGQRLGIANSPWADEGWLRLSPDPVPLGIEGVGTADNPRAFFINGRLHVFFNDQFTDPIDGSPISGIGLGITSFPLGLEQ
jgi:hypothetical protein